MMKRFKRLSLWLLSRLFSDKLANSVTKLVSRKLVEQVRTAATDDFLELLLEGMEMAFCISGSYRKNIDGFKAKYVFTTADGKVGATARFEDGDMHAAPTPEEDFTVRVQFKDAAALRRFLFAQRQDVLESILANEIEVTGNVNYIYKFGHMARDLERRLGLLEV
jgi:hypothetical protein